MNTLIGEAFVGEGAGAAHVVLAIGSKGTPFETAFLNALTQRSKGHITSLALLEPNLPSKPIMLRERDRHADPPAWSRSSLARSMPQWRTRWSIWWRTERSRKKRPRSC